MDMKKALWAVLVLSGAGALFSGTLTYQKLATGTCSLGEACTQLGPLPACAYGLIVYCAIIGISSFALYTNCKKQSPIMPKRKR